MVMTVTLSLLGWLATYGCWKLYKYNRQLNRTCQITLIDIDKQKNRYYKVFTAREAAYQFIEKLGYEIIDTNDGNVEFIKPKTEDKR